jgi:hypothetical protein
MTSNDFNLGLEGYQADHKTYTKTLKNTFSDARNSSIFKPQKACAMVKKL